MLTVLQCNGTIKTYETPPWWGRLKIEPMQYPERNPRIRKCDKLQATMHKIGVLRRSR